MSELIESSRKLDPEAIERFIEKKAEEKLRAIAREMIPIDSKTIAELHEVSPEYAEKLIEAITESVRRKLENEDSFTKVVSEKISAERRIDEDVLASLGRHKVVVVMIFAAFMAPMLISAVLAALGSPVVATLTLFVGYGVIMFICYSVVDRFKVIPGSVRELVSGFWGDGGK